MIKNKLHTLTTEHRMLLHNIQKYVPHHFHMNIKRMIESGKYSDQDKRIILNPLRDKYIEYLKQIKS